MLETQSVGGDGIALLKFFRYNWQVRDEWFDWCESVPAEELNKLRIGGVGSILKTLWHVVDAEYSWIRAVEGKPDVQFAFEDHTTVDSIRSWSDRCREELKPFLGAWDTARESQVVQASWRPEETIAAGEILRHVIAHESSSYGSTVGVGKGNR